MHKGSIGSADQVLRNARDRDDLAAKESIVCVEMEAGGVLAHKTKAVVVKGIPDYADGHKNGVWHNYAAIAAAVCAKELLQRAASNMVETERTVFGVGDLQRFSNSTINSAERRQRNSLRQGRERGAMGTSIDLMQILCASFSWITQDQEKARLGDPPTGEAAKKLDELTLEQEEMRKYVTQLSCLVDQSVQEELPIKRQEWEELKAKADSTAEEVDQLKLHTDKLRGALDIAKDISQLTEDPKSRTARKRQARLLV